MDTNLIVPGLKEAAALAMNEYNWTPARTLLEVTLPKDSVEYTQLQQIHVNDNIIKEACSRGFTELLTVFLNSGFPVYCIVCKSTGERMLHLAAINGHLSLIKLLLNIGADIDCKTCNGETPLFWAVRKGHLEVVRHLISTGADINMCSKDGKTLLEAAFRYKTVTEEMLQLLLDSGCDPDKHNYFSCYPLFLAVQNNKLNQVRMLLEAGAHVNGTDIYIPLQQAALQGSIPIMELLLEYGADINERDIEGCTALHIAVEKLQSVEFLIEHGSLINTVNNFKQTPLSLSFQYRQFDVALLLINSGADLNLDIHHMLLHRAICACAPVPMIECLLEHGADVTTLYYNKTALQYVISSSYLSSDKKLQIAKLLLIYGSNHYVEDRNGGTVLHWACRMGDLELVEYLIAYGLDVDAKNRQGKKPIDIAHETRHTNIVKAIIHYQCNKYTSF